METNYHRLGLKIAIIFYAVPTVCDHRDFRSTFALPMRFDIGVVDASTMIVTADREALTITREGQPMQFERRGQ